MKMTNTMIHHNFLLKLLRSLFLLTLISAKSLPVFAAGEEKREEKLQSLCPSGLSDYLNNNPCQEDHVLFQQWQSIVKRLAPVLKEGGAPSVFISHAWHESYYSSHPGEIDDAGAPLYYDQVDLHLARVLKDAGFEVFYDKDISDAQGIIDEGAIPFMEKKVKEANVILSVCTPLYHARSTYSQG